MKSLQGSLDEPEDRGDVEAREEEKEKREKYFSSAEGKQESISRNTTKTFENMSLGSLTISNTC